MHFKSSSGISFKQYQCTEQASTKLYAVPVLLHFTIWCNVTFSCTLVERAETNANT